MFLLFEFKISDDLILPIYYIFSLKNHRFFDRTPRIRRENEKKQAGVRQESHRSSVLGWNVDNTSGEIPIIWGNFP